MSEFWEDEINFDRRKPSVSAVRFTGEKVHNNGDFATPTFHKGGRDITPWLGGFFDKGRILFVGSREVEHPGGNIKEPPTLYVFPGLGIVGKMCKVGDWVVYDHSEERLLVYLHEDFIKVFEAAKGSITYEDLRERMERFHREA